MVSVCVTALEVAIRPHLPFSVVFRAHPPGAASAVPCAVGCRGPRRVRSPGGARPSSAANAPCGALRAH
ncbi:hypothetical protein LEMLEM_LOCUS18625 [Lemmus lemmus]